MKPVALINSLAIPSWNSSPATLAVVTASFLLTYVLPAADLSFGARCRLGCVESAPRCRRSDPRQRREDEQGDRGGHPGPADGDGAAHADLLRDDGGEEGAGGEADAMRDDLERGIRATEDPIRDETLHERDLPDTFDRL